MYIGIIYIMRVPAIKVDTLNVQKAINRMLMQIKHCRGWTLKPNVLDALVVLFNMNEIHWE